jgi:hypothetical protein
MRRKGELSPAGIDRGWPHKVALPARFCKNGGYKEIHDFCDGLSLCAHAVNPFTTGSGSRCIALQKLTTPKNSKAASVVWRSIRRNEVREAGGHFGIRASGARIAPSASILTLLRNLNLTC